MKYLFTVMLSVALYSSASCQDTSNHLYMDSVNSHALRGYSDRGDKYGGTILWDADDSTKNIGSRRYDGCNTSSKG